MTLHLFTTVIQYVYALTGTCISASYSSSSSAEPEADYLKDAEDGMAV